MNEGRYMIHAVPSRMWYVDGYLIPSMKSQGIRMDQIEVFCDTEGLGNLKAWMKSCEALADSYTGSTWHIQDDVLISSRFGQVTNKDNTGVICGFCSWWDKSKVSGNVAPASMWFSFQCIHIPNSLMKPFLHWMDTEAPLTYAQMIEEGKNDDALFRSFIKDKYKGTVRCLNPNIVEHVDWLIGGSVLNGQRKKTARAEYWEDEKMVIELANAIYDRKEKDEGSDGKAV